MQKEEIYHIYQKDDIVAHSLTFEQLCDKIKKDEIDVKEVEVLQLSPPQYTDASY